MSGIRVRQIIAVTMVILVVVAGYLEYSYRRNNAAASTADNTRIGEAINMGTGNALAGDQASVNSNSQDVAAYSAKSVNTTNTSKKVRDFFAQVRLDRDTTMGSNIDALKEIETDAGSGKDVKDQAYKQTMDLIKQSDQQVRIETLIKERGYNNVLAVFASDGSLDIDVEAASLDSAQIVQIDDIVSRQANIPISSIHIQAVN